MSKRTAPIFPRQKQQVETLGQRLALARLRRQIPQIEMAERMGVSRQTLIKLEAGDVSVGLSVLLRALDLLGLGADIERIAAEDDIGRRLEDVRLSRAPRRRTRPR
ncbi:MAG: helix-turn-helix transcriptional regulator [Acidobacteria bacterium]|nr:helix-turn-helix transcriptional regulator [Acidobacteriota bacterium]